MFKRLQSYSCSKKTAYLILSCIAFLCFVADQGSKYWAKGSLAFGLAEIRGVFFGLFSFRYVENRGAAFGILPGARWVFLCITLFVLIAVCLLVARSKRHGILQLCATGLLVGGALGNAYDRLAFHYVTDFIATTFIDFPVFNLADVFVSFGSVLLVLYIMNSDFDRGSSQEEAKDGVL